MKIVHVVSTFPPYKGGMGNSAYQYAKALSQAGEDVSVICPDYGESSVNFSLEKKPVGGGEPFNVERLKPVFGIGNAAFLPQIFWKLDGYDIVHLHYPFYGAACFVLWRKMSRGRKMKLVVHYHMDTVAGGLKGMIFSFTRRFILPSLLRMADAIVCSSLDYAKNSHLRDFYNLYGSKIKIVPLGVDVDHFSPPDDQDKPGKFVLFVGGLDRAHYFKGLEILVRAFAKLSVGNNYFLSIVGSGDMRGYYENLARELEIDGRVRFFGRIKDSELPDYYRQSDVLVLPSVNSGEAFGMVLLEAMATGKPVIASDLPGVRSVFSDGREGYFVRPGDIDDLAGKLESVLGNHGKAMDMGRAGRELVELKYSWPKVTAELLRVYKSLINHQS